MKLGLKEIALASFLTLSPVGSVEAQSQPKSKDSSAELKKQNEEDPALERMKANFVILTRRFLSGMLKNAIRSKCKKEGADAEAEAKRIYETNTAGEMSSKEAGHDAELDCRWRELTIADRHCADVGLAVWRARIDDAVEDVSNLAYEALLDARKECLETWLRMEGRD